MLSDFSAGKRSCSLILVGLGAWLTMSAVAQQPLTSEEDALIKKLFVRAQWAYEQENYGSAANEYATILAMDPENMFAQDGEQRAREAQVQAATAKPRDEPGGTKLFGDWMYPLATWETPVQRRGVERSKITRRKVESAEVTKVRRKLDRIIIPKVDFAATPWSEAVEFLRQAAVRLDPETDAGQRGVSVLLEPRGDWFKGPPNGGVPYTEPRVTLSMNRMSLREALRYVAKLAGMNLRIEPNSVVLGPDLTGQ